MIDLFIDTSLSYIRIVLFRNNSIIDSINKYVDKDLSRLFVYELKKLFYKNSISFNDVNKIYVVTGPGSFTGIRVGLTFVKVFAWAYKIPVVEISELQLLASTSFTTKYVVPIIDARRGYVYAGVYDHNLDIILSDRYISLDELLKNVDVNEVTFIGYDKYKLDVYEPNIDFKKIILKNCNSVTFNAHFLKPNYLKNTEAEDNLKKRLENDCKI